jgi:hypothetical protein
MTRVNEKGQAVVELPISQKVLTFRTPKGRDLKAIEMAAKTEETNVGALIQMASLLSVDSKAPEYFDDLDADDLLEVANALASFRAIRKLRE